MTLAPSRPVVRCKGSLFIRGVRQVCGRIICVVKETGAGKVEVECAKCGTKSVLDLESGMLNIVK